jgi:hypothetical protein
VKVIIWSVFLLLALLWTAGAALFAQLTEWSIGLLASGSAADLVDRVGQIAVPAWLAPWVDLTGWRELLQWFTSVLQTVSALLPSAGQSLGWLVPFIWILWGLGPLAQRLARGFRPRFSRRCTTHRQCRGRQRACSGLNQRSTASRPMS